MTGALTTIEKSELAQLEDTIQKGLKTFYEVGFALMQIRDNKYYREQYGTFEEYCKDRWGFTKSRANQLIAASEVADNLTTTVAISERAIRPLTKLSPDEQKEVYQKAVETAPEGKVTAKHIEKTIEARRPKLENYQAPAISERFNNAFKAMVEEIKRENLNGWKETEKATAKEMMAGLPLLIN